MDVKQMSTRNGRCFSLIPRYPFESTEFVNQYHKRKETNTRLTVAAHILKNQLNEFNTTVYALHWDEILIKFLMRIGNDIERVAILLTG